MLARSRSDGRWNAVYPLYFDAKVSASEGRRVPRKEAVWWPQATQIAKACRTLGLPSVLEVSRANGSGVQELMTAGTMPPRRLGEPRPGQDPDHEGWQVSQPHSQEP